MASPSNHYISFTEDEFREYKQRMNDPSVGSRTKPVMQQKNCNEAVILTSGTPASSSQGAYYSSYTKDQLR